MPEQPSSDTEYEAYLAGKTPLSKAYQQTPETGPSPSIDNAILNAAREEVTKKHSGASSKGYNWYVPAALAASIFVAVGIIRIYSTSQDTESEQIAGNTDKSAQPDITAASKSSPERMLDHISKLVDQSKTEMATEQYQAFVELFPNYDIDYNKYPNLKLIAKSR